MMKYHEGVRYLSDDGIGLANAGNSNRGEGGGAGIAPLNDDNADIVYSEEDDLRSSDEEDDDDAHGGENGKSDASDAFGFGVAVARAPKTLVREVGRLGQKRDRFVRIRREGDYPDEEPERERSGTPIHVPLAKSAFSTVVWLGARMQVILAHWRRMA